MPICNKCKQDLPVEDFHKRIYKSGRVSTQPMCKACKKTITQIRYAQKGEQIRKANKEYRENNPEKMREIRKAWWDANPKTKAFYAALYRARRDGNINPSIPVSELSELKEFYLNRPDGLVVDHIMPRNGRDGSRGLHIPENLQYLTPSENCRKSNKLPV